MRASGINTQRTVLLCVFWLSYHSVVMNIFYCRKRLVNSLVNKEPSPSAVDELKDVEDEIERIRKKVMVKEGIVAK